MRAVLRTLAQCHAHRILHRDVKPGNFMLLTEAEDSPLKAIGTRHVVGGSPGTCFLARVGVLRAFVAVCSCRLAAWGDCACLALQCKCVMQPHAPPAPCSVLHTDFGLAVFFDPAKLPRTDLGLEGTPWYMAPEVGRGQTSRQAGRQLTHTVSRT